MKVPAPILEFLQIFKLYVVQRVQGVRKIFSSTQANCYNIVNINSYSKQNLQGTLDHPDRQALKEILENQDELDWMEPPEFKDLLDTFS